MMRPNPRLTSAVLNGMAVLSAIFACGVGVLKLKTRTPWQPPPVTGQPVTKPTVVGIIPESGDLSVLTQRNLRERLIASPATPPAPTPPPASLAFRLVGTIVDGETHFAIFDRGGGTVLRQLGEDLDGFQIREIQPGRAVLYRGTSTFELEMPKEPKLPIQSGS